MGDKKVNIIYLCMHKRLLDKSDIDGVIERKKFYEIICRLYHLPSRLKKIVLDEMIEMDLIERINKRYLKILENNIHLKNTSLVYKDI